MGKWHTLHSPVVVIATPKAAGTSSKILLNFCMLEHLPSSASGCLTNAPFSG
jgi:hypothetical protein